MYRSPRIPVLPAIMLVLITTFHGAVLFAQEAGAIPQEPTAEQPDGKTLDRLGKKYSRLEKEIDRQSQQLLTRMQQREADLQKKVRQQDSAKAVQLFAGAAAKYRSLQDRLQTPAALVPRPVQEYIPRLDSLQAAFHYLQAPALRQQLQQLQGRMQQTGEIQDFIRQREQQLQDQLQGSGMSSGLLGINKEVYYYQQRLAGYKALFNDPGKMEETAMGLIRQLPAFQAFMQRNSYLALLYPMPAGYGTPQALAGLQTSSAVAGSITQSLAVPGGGGGTNPQQYLQQQAQAGQDQLTQLKNKIAKAGGSSSDMEMPQFQPNTQKTKKIWQRIEYGFNIQSRQTTALLPASSDLALTLGYKLSDKATAGLGAAYQLGWGRDLSHLSLSSQGIGLRSYLDIQARGSIWITGGFEYNYQHEFEKLTQIRNLDIWQKSALTGITKKFRLGSRTANFQLLYDWLANIQTPRAQAIKFRVGYTF